MSKSTHIGSCQCCGRVQKLPGGSLSKHGYTKEWGFFNGTCPGAHHKPYEQDCSLIKTFIADAKARVKLIQQHQSDLRQPCATGKAWVREYVGGRYNGGHYVRGHYVWVERVISERKTTYETWTNHIYSYQDAAGKVHEIPTSYDENRAITIEAACTKLNCAYAASMDKDIKQLESYIKWQQKRVDDWKLTPLKPAAV